MNLQYMPSGIAMKVATAVPGIAYLTVDWITGNTAISVAISLSMVALTAIITTRPKLIAARAAALVNTTAAHDQHMSTVVKQLTEMHQREIAFWRDSAVKQEKIEILIRATKHRLIAAYQGASFWIHDLEDVLRNNKIEFQRYRSESFVEITGNEDSAMISMLFKEPKSNG